MKVFPEILTERLKLGKVSVGLLPALHKAANNKIISDNTSNIPHPYSEKDAARFLQMHTDGFNNKSHFIFAITEKNSGHFLGCCGLTIYKENNRAELGYWISQDYWNKGIASEAVAALISFGFEKIGLHKIFATHFTYNPASGRVLVKNGMVQEGELKDHLFKNNKYETVIQYRITADEYAARK